jgi:porphobilinogen synthase
MEIRQRPRRNRKSQALRSLVRENSLNPSDFIWPVFLCEGTAQRQEIKSLPGVYRLSADVLLEEAKIASKMGIHALALFPAVDDSKKDPLAKESHNPDSLLHRSLKTLKEALPELLLISDVAMDPYSSDGHDGVYRDGKIHNDETLEILARMAIEQAKSGADMVAPSDMMDGRVGYIRQALDQEGFSDVGILSYTAKYCSAFYGPFRDALSSAPRAGDKKSYQMDPANSREALREAELDVEEGADMLMVKPALAYLDIISLLSNNFSLPIAAYQVSGEYAMIKAASKLGWLDETKAMVESLLSIKRAGADIIITYFAKNYAKLKLV